eukprot:scaffold43759_cov28-Tisochrysis_lutea.AAC.2
MPSRWALQESWPREERCLAYWSSPIHTAARRGASCERPCALGEARVQVTRRVSRPTQPGSQNANSPFVHLEFHVAVRRQQMRVNGSDDSAEMSRGGFSALLALGVVTRLVGTTYTWQASGSGIGRREQLPCGSAHTIP